MSFSSPTYLISWLMALLLINPISSFAENLPVEKLQSISESQYHLVSTNEPMHDYHLFVHLPKNYTEDTKSRFPVIYMLDGGYTFPMLASYYKLINLVDNTPDVILVGIGYGTSEWKEGNARGRDFTAPSQHDDRKHWGGAEKFSQVLSNDIFSLIDSHYRTDPKRRIMFGNSLGGQFGIYLAQFHPELVYGVIASNPSIHTNVEYFLTEPQKIAKSKPALHTKLFIAQGELDGKRYIKPRQRWLRHWQSNPNPNWALKFKTLPGHTHVSGLHDAFRLGLEWILLPKDNT